MGGVGRPKSAGSMATRTICDPFSFGESLSENWSELQQPGQAKPQVTQRSRRKKERVSPFTRKAKPASAESRTRRRPGTAGNDLRAASGGLRVHMLDFSPTGAAVSAENEGAWRGRAANRHANARTSSRIGKLSASRHQQPALVPTYYSTPHSSVLHTDVETRVTPGKRIAEPSTSKLSVRQPMLEIEPKTAAARQHGLPGRVYRSPTTAKSHSRSSSVVRPLSAGSASSSVRVRPQSAGGAVTQLELDIQETQETALQSSLSDWVGSTVRIPYGLHSPAIGTASRGAQISFSEGDDLAIRLPPDGKISEWTMEMDREGGRDLSAESYAKSSTATVGLSDTVQEQFNLMIHNDVVQRARLADSPVSVVAVQPQLPVPMGELKFPTGAASPPVDTGMWQVDRSPTTPGAANASGGFNTPLVSRSQADLSLLHKVAQAHCAPQPPRGHEVERTAWTPSPQARQRQQQDEKADVYVHHGAARPIAAMQSADTSVNRPMQLSGPITGGWLPSELRQAVGSMRLRSLPLTAPVQRVGARA